MTREEYEKQKKEALENRRKSKFVATKGSFIIKAPDDKKTNPKSNN